MNWENVDLNDSYERDQSLISSLSFDKFLWEIECNEKEINEATLQRHFDERLAEIAEEAREVFQLNRANLTKNAQERRAMI